MSRVTTTGGDISGLLTFSKAQLSERLAMLSTLNDRADDLIEAIMKAMSEQHMMLHVSGTQELELVFDVPADSESGLPAVKGILSLTGRFSGAGFEVREVTFPSSDQQNALFFSFKGKLSYQFATGLLVGTMTEFVVTDTSANRSLEVIGLRKFDLANQASGRIDGIKYTEAGITTEITGRLSIDQNDSISGTVRSLSIYDISDPTNKISWSGKFDYAELAAASASVASVKDIFSDQAMAVLFSGGDVFDVQSKDTLSETGASVQTTWFAHAGNDLMKGGAGKEWFDGGTGNDRLYGGGGNDTLKGNAGNDRVYGDDGNDLLEGDAGNDWLEGGSGADHVRGGAGNDRVIGGDGDDNLYGGTGNDRMEGGKGDDVLIGEEGNDIYLDLEGDNSIEDEYGNNRVTTGAGSDVIYTNGPGSNKINAGDGNNRVVCADGNDMIVTGKGSDNITGGGGNDLIRAGAGDDKIDAGAGVDWVFGGAGADEFVLGTLYDKDYVRIADFKATDGDLVFFDTFVFTDLNAGTLSQQFVANNTGVATTEQQRVIFDTRNGKLYYDEDGSGSLQADHIATLIGVKALSVEQIILPSVFL